MSFRLVFKPRAAAELAEAFAWYDQPTIRQGEAFFAELERVERFIRLNPLLYPEVDPAIHRANLRLFPYSLFYVVDGEVISVLSCFHQHRDPDAQPRSDEP
ncbi:type II toxin-antitoxin system RelE/ParE family toxin [Roseateles paludis]|jgi:plasmid stabilization system protein ParE|uniref:Type II toxin-antitoxin system RelE/ParE family toxin n=1 Tax=Roseateles paludis TaxID=3145238 RepID=A0ABV0G730_9BURK